MGKKTPTSSFQRFGGLQIADQGVGGCIFFIQTPTHFEELDNVLNSPPAPAVSQEAYPPA